MAAQTRNSGLERQFRLKNFNPRILTNLVLKKSHKDKIPITFLPSMQKLGIINGMSVGPESRNMAKRFEPNKAHEVLLRNKGFLKSIGASYLQDSFLMLKAKRKESPILDITADLIIKASVSRNERKDAIVNTEVEAMITTESVALIAKLADCYPMVIYGKTSSGKPILALLHLSRDQIDNLLIEKVVRHLSDPDIYGCRPEKMNVGIFPGMGYPYSTITAGDEDKYLTPGVWDGFMEPHDSGIVKLNPLGNIFFQLKKMGIRDNLVEAYGDSDEVDTFAMAGTNPPQAFSHRYSTHTSQPERDGRNLVVVQLPLNLP